MQVSITVIVFIACEQLFKREVGRLTDCYKFALCNYLPNQTHVNSIVR